MKDPTKPPYMCDDHEYYSETTPCPRCEESCIVTTIKSMQANQLQMRLPEFPLPYVLNQLLFFTRDDLPHVTHVGRVTRTRDNKIHAKLLNATHTVSVDPYTGVAVYFPKSALRVVGVALYTQVSQAPPDYNTLIDWANTQRQQGRVTQQARHPQSKSISDDDIRALWVAHGGSFHGPTVETGTMPEEKLLPFLRKLLEAK